MKLLQGLFYAAQGYCVQQLCGGFLLPKRDFSSASCLRIHKWLAGAVWIVTETGLDALIAQIHQKPYPAIDDVAQTGALKIGKTLLCFMVLYVFCLCWYQGKWLSKLFLAIQFLSLRQLSIWAGYSLNLLGQRKLQQLSNSFLNGQIETAKFIKNIELLELGSTTFVWLVQCLVLLFFIRKIVKNYHGWEPEHADKTAAFYLLPAVTGLLIDLLLRLIVGTVEDGRLILLYTRYPVFYLVIPVIAIVLMLAIVFSFQSCQEMAVFNQERAERIVLENQIIQLKTSIKESQQMYDTLRSVRHDIKNHLMVLRGLLLQNAAEIHEEIWRYFEDLCQSAELLDCPIHTGNAVSDAIINTKFGYACKEIPSIRLDAEGFALPDAAMLKPYDIGIILNNGLDNAIEACMRLHRQNPDAQTYITIRSFRAKNMLFIEIENSFDGVILLRDDSGFPITTKEDKEVHGIGLKNIRNCAAKYGGDVDCIVENERFTLSVMVACDLT